MDFGISVMTSTHSWKVVQRAEALGFSHAWFYDSQLLCADVYAVMALAAANTSRIKLGTGVAIPSNRIVPVTASALATLNELAPGRIMFGVGTGFTGRRCMGLNAVKLEDMARYVDEVYALLREETVEVELEGKHRKIRLRHPCGYGVLADGRVHRRSGHLQAPRQSRRSRTERPSKKRSRCLHPQGRCHRLNSGQPHPESRAMHSVPAQRRWG